MKTVAPDSFNKFLEFCQRFKIDFVFEPYTKYPTGAEWRQHFDGKTPLEYLYDAGLSFELDVGHVKLASGCPVAWLKKLAGRVPSIHAKPGGGNSVGGDGDANDWKAIFSAAAASGTKWAIVECETRRDTFEEVETSMAFLKSLVTP